MTTLLIASQQLPAAQEHAKLLLEKQPNDPQSHIVQAKLLSAQDDLAGAIGEVQKAIALAPNRGDSYLSLAVLQMKAGLQADAEPNFKKAVALDPQSVSAHSHWGSSIRQAIGSLRRRRNSSVLLRSIQAARSPAPPWFGFT